MSKCHVCKEQEAEWGWRFTNPKGRPNDFTLLGPHVRGLPIVKVCLSCKSAVQSGGFAVRFTYKGHTYLARDHEVQETDISLWDGGACSTDSLHPSDATAIMLDTPESHELVALVLKDVPPTTPDLVKAFLIAPNLIEACEELDAQSDRIARYLEMCSIDKADYTAIMMTLAKIRLELKRARGEE